MLARLSNRRVPSFSNGGVKCMGICASLDRTFCNSISECPDLDKSNPDVVWIATSMAGTCAAKPRFMSTCGTLIASDSVPPFCALAMSSGQSVLGASRQPTLRALPASP